jgi:hypothetical protein
MTSHGKLSGADIEAIVGRALRRSLLAGTEEVRREALAEAATKFLPSTQGIEKDLQETAAILECTDLEFLPSDVVQNLTAAGGREELQERYTRLRQLVAFT